MNYYRNLVSVDVRLSMRISWKINTQPAATFVTRLLSTRQMHGGLVFCQAQQEFLLFFKRTYIWLCRWTGYYYPLIRDLQKASKSTGCGWSIPGLQS